MCIRDRIKAELDSCDFIGIQADETLDVSSRFQFILIFRFCSKEGPIERFIGFYDVSVDKTASGISELIVDVLKKWGVTEKVAVSYTHLDVYKRQD